MDRWRCGDAEMVEMVDVEIGMWMYGYMDRWRCRSAEMSR